MEENKDMMPEEENQTAAEENTAEEENQTVAEENTAEEENQTAAEENTAENAAGAEAFVQAVQGGVVKPKKDWKKEAVDWIMSIAAALLIVFVIRNFLFQIIRVDGDSMYDTLLNNERLFVTVLDVKLNGVERDDIVICHYPNRGNTNFVKRAVGVPGDTVYRENGVTHVVYETTDENGETQIVDEALDENYAQYFPNGSSTDYEPYTLGEDEYFVVGDNRYNSHDSRDWNDTDPSADVGPITGDMLVGKVRCVLFPFSNFRTFD